jgi:NADH-quinone oxidoreductase subunit G
MTEAQGLVKVTIDDVTVEVPKNSLLIEAAGKAGVHIPRFCYHPKLSLAGATHLLGLRREDAEAITAHDTRRTDGRAHQHADVVDTRRSASILLLDHRRFRLRRGGSVRCKLLAPVRPEASRSSIPKRRAQGRPPSPLVVPTWSAIPRCTRFMMRSRATRIAFYDRGATSVLGTFEGQPRLKFGQHHQALPVGALDELHHFREAGTCWRPVCGHCAVGCAVRYEARRGGRAREAAQHEDVNEVWLCDRATGRA